MARARAIVLGRVQGVYFRAETRSRAAALGLAGFVRNLPDGAVEAVFEGEPEAVEQILAWCRRGPAGASVEAVDVVREEPEGLGEFSIR